MISRVGGDTLLHFACKEDYADLVDCLLEHEADVMEKCVFLVLDWEPLTNLSFVMQK